MLASLIDVVIVLLVVGVGMWLVNLIPMASGIRSILNGIVIIAVCLWLLRVFGIPLPLSGPLLSIVVRLIVLGTLMWVINTYVPMSAAIRSILNVVVVVVVCLWLLRSFGLASMLSKFLTP